MNHAIRIPTEHVDMGQETSGLTILCGYVSSGTSSIPLGPCPDLAPTALWVDPGSTSSVSAQDRGRPPRRRKPAADRGAPQQHALSRPLTERLQVDVGATISVEVLKGHRREPGATVTLLVDEIVGMTGPICRSTCWTIFRSRG
jgi:hypothetical protein